MTSGPSSVGRSKGSYVQLEVDGLVETARALKKISPALGRAIPKALRKFAIELKARTVREAGRLGGVHAHAVGGGGVKHFARSSGAGLKLAASKSPTILGAEYGSKQWSQFPPWRGNQFTDKKGSGVGYMMHPAMRDYLPTAEEKLYDELLAAINEEIEA